MKSVLSFFPGWIELLLNFGCHKYKFIFETDFLASPFLIIFVKIQILIRDFKAYVGSSFSYIQRTKSKCKLVLNDTLATGERAFFLFFSSLLR